MHNEITVTVIGHIKHSSSNMPLNALQLYLDTILNNKGQ